MDKDARALAVCVSGQPTGNTSRERPRRIVIANALAFFTAARSCSTFVMRSRPIPRMTSFARSPALRGRAAFGARLHQHARAAIRVARTWRLRTRMNLRSRSASRAVALADDCGHAPRFAFAHQTDLDLLADAQQADRCCAAREALAIVAAVDRGDHVARLDAGLVGRRAASTTCETSAPRALSRPRLSRDVRRELVRQLHAEHAALDLAVLHELRHHGLDHVRRDREADADVAAAAGEDRGVHADQLALQIRPARRRNCRD